MAINSVARKHHYIPQSYLKAFTSSETKDSQFYVLDLENGRSFRTTPSNVAAIRDFNRIDIDGRSPDELEKALAPFEGDAANAIRRVLETQSFPGDEDWNLILNLISLIAVRNPRMRNSFNQSRKQTLLILGEMLARDKKLWESHMRKARASGQKMSEVSFEQFKRFIEIGNYSYVFHTQENLRIEFKTFDTVLRLLGQRIWSILIAPNEGPEFICSDHPVTLYRNDGGSGYLGYGMRNTEVFFPLGRRIGFFGMYESPLKTVINCSPLNVAKMNQRIVNNAERQVYSALDTFTVWYKNSTQEIRCKF